MKALAAFGLNVANFMGGLSASFAYQDGRL